MIDAVPVKDVPASQAGASAAEITGPPSWFSPSPSCAPGGSPALRLAATSATAPLALLYFLLAVGPLDGRLPGTAASTYETGLVVPSNQDH
jgi:hypothetical protein